MDRNRNKITMEKENKVYVIRKFVVAKDLKEALKKEPKAKVQEVYLEEESLKGTVFRLTNKNINI